MKSGFYYTNPERKNPIKNLKILFKPKITIKWPKNAIIIKTRIFGFFRVFGPYRPRFGPYRSHSTYRFFVQSTSQEYIAELLEITTFKIVVEHGPADPRRPQKRGL